MESLRKAKRKCETCFKHITGNSIKINIFLRDRHTCLKKQGNPKIKKNMEMSFKRDGKFSQTINIKIVTIRASAFGFSLT